MRCLAILVLTAAVATAQYPAGANVLRWDGVTSSAGPFCWGFSCVPELATVVPGESGTLLIRAEVGQPYILAVATGANRCLALPGFHNALVLDDPIFVLNTGICGFGSPVLSCPGGQATLPITFPLGLPSGYTLAVQALTGVPGGSAAGSFTQGLVFLVL